jgi:hypothetical protein
MVGRQTRLSVMFARWINRDRTSLLAFWSKPSRLVVRGESGRTKQMPATLTKINKFRGGNNFDAPYKSGPSKARLKIKKSESPDRDAGIRWDFLIGLLSGML